MSEEKYDPDKDATLCQECHDTGKQQVWDETKHDFKNGDADCAVCKGEPKRCRTCGHADKTAPDHPCVPKWAVYMPADQTIMYLTQPHIDCEETTVHADAHLFEDRATAEYICRMTWEPRAAYQMEKFGKIVNFFPGDIEKVLDVVEFKGREDTW